VIEMGMGKKDRVILVEEAKVIRKRRLKYGNR